MRDMESKACSDDLSTVAECVLDVLAELLLREHATTEGDD